MRASCVFLLGLLTLAAGLRRGKKRYQPDWASLDSRPLPSWYDEAKVGVFVHWSIFSVPAFGSEWFLNSWKNLKDPRFVRFMDETYGPDFRYDDFAPMFTAELYDPDAWAKMFKAAGAHYVVFTSKHHEGWANYPTNTSINRPNWNSVVAGPHRDLLGDLVAALRREGLRVGIYTTLFEWFNPALDRDIANNYTTSEFVDTVWKPSFYELVNRYQPDLLWADGDWIGPWEWWQSRELLAWLFNDSPVKDHVVVNDRWGGSLCRHGSYWTCADNFNPQHLMGRKWENAFTMQQNDYTNPTTSWAYNRNASLSGWWTSKKVITQLVQTFSCGGNALVNVGPMFDGTIPFINQQQLQSMGSFLQTNGEAVYGAQPWRVQNDSLAQGVWYTKRTGVVYAHLLQWPASGSLDLAAPQSIDNVTTVSLLRPAGQAEELTWSRSNQGLTGMRIVLPRMSPADPLATADAWVLRMVHVH